MRIQMWHVAVLLVPLVLAWGVYWLVRIAVGHGSRAVRPIVARPELPGR